MVSEVWPLAEVVTSLENAGEVSLSVAEHQASKDSGAFKVNPPDAVIFLLDAPKEKKKKPKA